MQVETRDERGRTPLHVAASSRAVHILLLAGADAAASYRDAPMRRKIYLHIYSVTAVCLMQGLV